MKNYVSYDPNTKEIVISGLATERLMIRIDELYSSRSDYSKRHPAKIRNLINSMNNIDFYTTEIRFYSFFALEFYEMFQELAYEYHDRPYEDVANELYEKTWISKADKADRVKMDTSSLVMFTIKPEPFQLDFIQQYSGLKYAYDLDGYILGFEQGLGKTFTSIALAECLHKERIYIVCPNSAKENWANEIKSYYRKYQGNDRWKDDIYASGISGYKYDSGTKFVIVNQESIPSIFPMVDPRKDSMIIVDECQNFRGYKSQRVAAMLKLKEMTKCKDNLLMSGTPIKALANEIVPALLMIDPHFTPELAEIFYKTFSDKSTETSAIVATRFKRVIYRKMKKDVLKDLPEKYITDLRLSIPHPERYNLNRVTKEITAAFHEEYLRRLKSGLFTNNKQSSFYRSTAKGYDFITEQARFEKIVRSYSRASQSATETYLDSIFQRTKDNADVTLITSQNVEQKYFSFLERFVQPFIRDKSDLEVVTNRFNGIGGWAIAAKSASASVFGKMYAESKNNCFTEMWDYNYQIIIDMINKAKKKTVIFTALVPIADHISSDLMKRGLRNIEITGFTTGRMKAIEKFKTDPNIKVLVATTETLGTAITLTEANQIIFFGTPWRNADFIQACDRIHRIGQDTDCYIYNALLKSQDKNITERIAEVMNWSEDMFNSLITEAELFRDVK